MAKIVNNKKGFLVIKANLSDIAEIGGIGLCDFCNEVDYEGYYIAVLNKWYCRECYADWNKRAKRYEQDTPIEERNFETYKRIWKL